MGSRYFVLSKIALFFALLFVLPLKVEAARLKGKLVGESPDSYKIIAISRDGRSAAASIGTNGRFTLKARRNATLHLLQTSGRYVGPIVLTKGARAYTKVNGASGVLGRVALRDGFASLRYRKASELYQTKKSIAFNKATGTKGSGNLGLVNTTAASKRTTARADLTITAAQQGDDTDSDGLPDILDVDDDGDLELDVTDSDSKTESAFEPESFSTLRLFLRDSLNYNAGTFTASDIDSAIESYLRIAFFIRNNTGGEKTVDKVNVNCQELSYCTAGNGSAVVDTMGTDPADNSLWTDYDPDNDGFPNLPIESPTGSMGAFLTVFPKVTTSKLKPGDTLLFEITSGSQKFMLPGLLPFYFITTPAVKEYDAGTGTTQFSYPIGANEPGVSMNKAIQLESQSVTLTLWRPQRLAMGDESGNYIDIGQLTYGVYLSPFGSSDVITCVADDFSDLSETLQKTNTTDAGIQILKDTAADAPANANNTLTFTLDLGACLTRAGQDTTGLKVMMDLTANSARNDQTSQGLYFELP